MSEDIHFVASKAFEAARDVSILPEGHKARSLHGHSFNAKIRSRLTENTQVYPGAEVQYLETRLYDAIQSLNYSYLNDIVDIPTDENLTRWIRDQLNIEEIDVVGITSASDQGIDMDKKQNSHIWRKYRFESAHNLPRVPYGHQCGRIHGHGFEVIIHVEQNLEGEDIGVDYDLIDKHWKPIHEQFHLKYLNDIKGLENPTSEMISSWIWDYLKPTLPELSWVTVYETRTAGCHYDGNHYRIWKEFPFESACRLDRAPLDNPRHMLHGHSYISRLHLTAPLDQVMGWTIDYGDVKEIFKPIYNQLDHHLLNSLPDAKDGDVVSILNCIKFLIGERLPQLDRIDLYETPGCGAILSWGDDGPALPI